MLNIESSKKGAELTSIKLDGIERLHQGNAVVDENGNAYWGRHAPVLFPIVGKIKDNKTKINGEIYEMTQHGFARDMEFELLKKQDDYHKYVLKSNKESLKKFPFKFELYIEYIIENNELITKYTVINKDEKDMLFGIGGHPAFVCEYSNGNYELEFEKIEDKIEFYKLQEGLIKESPISNVLDDNKIKLTSTIFDEDAIIMKNISSDNISLRDIKNNKKVLEFSFAGFPYLAIWSKKGAPFVCIEPWQNHADSVNSNGIFEEKENIMKLSKEEQFSCSYKVKFF